MKIGKIRALLKEDFACYKKTLLENQKKILDNFEEEKIFISVLSPEELEEKIEKCLALSENHGFDKFPLLGVPFVVKDNIDVKGFDTTAGCPGYSYTPEFSAFAVARPEEAGAICIGKANLDQFATGLVGTRSPYGTAINYYNTEYIPGGSSSGSASSLTAGYAAFSLGTDTAGSGRVPAAFQNLIGVKPSRGIVSATGVVPACKSLDCVSVFASLLEDAQEVLDIISLYDGEDVYSRSNQQKTFNKEFKIAVPQKENLKFFGNKNFEKAYKDFIGNLKDAGYHVEELDFSPLFDAAKLLYNGPWVAERYHAVGSFIEAHSDETFPVTKDIILGGKDIPASVYFDSEYKLNAYRKVFEEYSKIFDYFLMPTAGTIYKKEEIEKDPVSLNSNLGYYTNFMNLLDCCALALPVAITENNLPFGVTLFAPAFNDKNLLSLAFDWDKKGLLNIACKTKSAFGSYIDLAVCGAHKRGGSLNYQLTDIDAVFKETTVTAGDYRFYALEDLDPVRPGLIKDPGKGEEIEVEIWKVPQERLGNFINQIGAPLGFGKVKLKDGSEVTSFLCEPYVIDRAKEITHLKTWEEYLKQKG